MNEKRRPPSLHRGPAPVQEPEQPEPGLRHVVFYFENGGDAAVSLPESSIPNLRQFASQAWSVDRGMYSIDTDDGQSVLVNMAKVRMVEIR